MRLSLWPQSLFVRLLAASVAAVLLAQAAALLLIAQERERFVLQGSVREWTRRIVETTQMLQPLSAAERLERISELSAPRGHVHMPHPPPDLRGADPRPPQRGFVRLPLLSDFEQTLKEQLRAALGPAYTVEIGPTPEPPPAAIPVAAPFYEAHELAGHQAAARRYDVSVRFADGDSVIYRLTRMPGGAPLPRNLLINLTLLVLLLVIVLYAAARNCSFSACSKSDSSGRRTKPRGGGRGSPARKSGGGCGMCAWPRGADSSLSLSRRSAALSGCSICVISTMRRVHSRTLLCSTKRSRSCAMSSSAAACASSTAATEAASSRTNSDCGHSDRRMRGAAPQSVTTLTPMTYPSP